MSNPVQSMRILIVEDDADIRWGLLGILQQCNVEAKAVPDAREALEVIAADPGITVMLTDIKMPDMDGLTLTALAQNMRPDATALEVVALTGGRSPAVASEAVSEGIFAFLHKPIRVQPLLEALRGAHAAAVSRRQGAAAKA